MKLLGIRLHPFGASSDRTLPLGDGLNLIEGPNELGKSTLQHGVLIGILSCWYIL